ncbi:MAG: SpoIIE family protein phosphatase [Leptospiraceae bacterium]|nr:SpoIIE family protein phosphatase [Leptospiraceae bacterium]
MSNFNWRMILPGIRTKLSIFTILFAGLIIFVMSQLFIRQQRMALFDSFEKELAPSKNYIGSIVYDLERISQSLVLIEDFRIRVKESKKALAANRNTGSYQQDRKALFGLVNLNKTFGSVGIKISKKQVNYDYETFFSKYLTEKEIKELESNIRIHFRDNEGKPISDKMFLELQTLANKIVLAERSLADTIEKKLNQSFIDNNKKNINVARNNLRQKILSFFEEEQKQKIRELELATSKFRIQSFSILPIADTYVAFPGFDTSIFEPKANVNSKELEKFLNPELDKIVSILNSKENISQNISSGEKFLFENRNFQTQYDFFYMNNDSVNRANYISKSNLKENWKQFIEEDKKFQTELTNIIEKIKNRIETLKKEKLGTKATLSKDKEFASSYKEYKSILEKREKLILEVTKKQEGYAEFSKLNKDISVSEELKFKDALATIREIALYDFVVLKFRANPNHYFDYLASDKLRQNDLSKIKKIRSWIMEGAEEGVPQDLKKIIDTGMISHSRSEAEEYMWKLDTTPIISDGNDLATELIQVNKIGFTRVLVDMQEGFDRIEKEKQTIEFVAYSIGFVALISAFFFSGILVKKIKRIIISADELGKGNLETKFQHGGSDEFGILTTALNKMTSDLKQRQEMLVEYAAAEDIQKGLLPTSVPFQDSLEFGNFYKSMSGVGGDYYDFIELDSDRMVFCIGDVSNHGIGPALVMVALRSQLRGLIRAQETNLREILLSLNDQVFGDTPSNIFVTFFIGLFHKKTGRIDFFNCGHSKPIVYRAKTNSLETKEAGGMPLGAIDNFIFESTIEESSLVLESGDLFFQYTDGLNEAMNHSSELFGNERLEKILLSLGKSSPNQITETIAKEVEKFSQKKIFCDGPSELNDDIAMIAFKRI